MSDKIKELAADLADGTPKDPNLRSTAFERILRAELKTLLKKIKSHLQADSANSGIELAAELQHWNQP